MGIFGMGVGMQMLLNSQQRVLNAGQQTVSLVVELFSEPAVPAITDLGFTQPSTGSPSQVKSFEIDPPPDASELSLRMMVEATQAGMELRMGSRRFTVSHTWVAAQQLLLEYPSPKDVFTNPAILGIRYAGVLYAVVDAVPNMGMGDTPISWDVFCNAPLP